MSVRLAMLLCLLGTPRGVFPQTQGQLNLESYSPVYLNYDYETGGKLVVFGAGTTSIAMPFSIGGASYSTDGTAIYAQTKDWGSCLHKIEFNPVRTRPVMCLPGLVLHDIDVSRNEDEVLFSGVYGQPLVCGVFLVTIPAGIVRTIVVSECGRKDKWRSLSLSPDGKQAVGICLRGIQGSTPSQPYSLVLIDLQSGNLKVVGSGFFIASWSPDGRWIAGVQNPGRFNRAGKTVIFDAKSLAIVKKLPDSWGRWSPDGRFLERVAECGNEAGTIEAISVETGRSTPIQSSKCQIWNGSAGWMSNSILPSEPDPASVAHGGEIKR